MNEYNKGSNDRKRPAMPDLDTSDLQQAILLRTMRVVHRRRWIRRVAAGTVLAVFYLAGIGTMQAWNVFLKTTAPQELAAGSVTETTPNENATSKKDIPKVAPNGIVARTNGNKIISKQDRPKLSRFEAICKISDRYLYRDADTVAAIRGYRRALRVATPEELKICPQRDSWLLMALKQELNEKENRDEKRGA